MKIFDQCSWNLPKRMLSGDGLLLLGMRSRIGFSAGAATYHEG